MTQTKRIAPAVAIMLALACSSSGDDDSAATMATGSGGSTGTNSGMMIGSGGSASSGMMTGSGGSTSSGMMAGSGGSLSAGMTTGSGGSTSSGMMTGSGGMGGTGTAGKGAPASVTCKAPEPSTKPGNECKGTMPPAIKLTMISDKVVGPTLATQAPGDPTRLYVLEQQGTIQVIKDGAMNAAPLLDLRMLNGDAMVNSTGVAVIDYAEAGLLGMVFDPDFENTHRFWLSYNKGAGYTTSILAFVMDDPDTVDVTKGEELLTVPQPSFNHKGGMIAFGPDGCLYLGMGDGGMEGDPMGTGQGSNDLLGVMLRIDVDKYPMAAPGNLAEHIWSTGLRNPWRFSFDRETGDLYMGDVGQDEGTGFEEVNIEPKGTVGRNYGWSVQEGSMCHSGQDCTGMTTPAFDYPITSNANSVIGGFVYRGKAMPDMVGRYIFADWTERKLKTLIYKGETNGQPEICDQYDTSVTVTEKVRAFGEDLDGEIYVMASGTGTGLDGAGPSTVGKLYKIEPQ